MESVKQETAPAMRAYQLKHHHLLLHVLGVIAGQQERASSSPACGSFEMSIFGTVWSDTVCQTHQEKEATQFLFTPEQREESSLCRGKHELTVVEMQSHCAAMSVFNQMSGLHSVFALTRWVHCDMLPRGSIYVEEEKIIEFRDVEICDRQRKWRRTLLSLREWKWSQC